MLNTARAMIAVGRTDSEPQPLDVSVRTVARSGCHHRTHSFGEAVRIERGIAIVASRKALFIQNMAVC